jgi:hypothetical protein
MIGSRGLADSRSIRSISASSGAPRERRSPFDSDSIDLFVREKAVPHDVDPVGERILSPTALTPYGKMRGAAVNDLRSRL